MPVANRTQAMFRATLGNRKLAHSSAFSFFVPDVLMHGGAGLRANRAADPTAGLMSWSFPYIT